MFYKNQILWFEIKSQKNLHAFYLDLKFELQGKQEKDILSFFSRFEWLISVHHGSIFSLRSFHLHVVIFSLIDRMWVSKNYIFFNKFWIFISYKIVFSSTDFDIMHLLYTCISWYYHRRIFSPFFKEKTNLTVQPNKNLMLNQ